MTDSEWDILQALWRLQQGTSSEIAEALADTRGWAPSTVRTFLGRMKDKGLVRAHRVGKTWVYEPATERAKTQRAAWQEFADTAFGSVGGALRFLAKDAQLTRAQKARLLEMLEDGDA